MSNHHTSKSDIVQSEPIETMTSTQLADILGKEKKHIHEALKKLFGKDLDGREIRPCYDSRGYVDYYELGELESKMFVAKHDIQYLEKITQYWIDRHKEDPLTELELMQKQIAVMVRHEKQLKAMNQKQEVFDIRLHSVEDKTRFVGQLEEGYIDRRTGWLLYGSTISYDVFKRFINLVKMPSKPYQYLGNGSKVHDSIQLKIEHIQQMMMYILTTAKQATTYWFTHDLHPKRFKIDSNT